MAALAEQHSVVEIGRSGIPLPPAQVMRPGELRGQPAHHATAVAFYERESLGGGEQPLLTPPVEDLALTAEHDGDDAPTRRHPTT